MNALSSLPEGRGEGNLRHLRECVPLVAAVVGVAGYPRPVNDGDVIVRIGVCTTPTGRWLSEFGQLRSP